jgi:predicted Zn-dependent protease
MGASAGDNKNVPSFLSTHPAIEERVRIANERIAKSSRVSARVPAPLERIWGEIKQDNGW